MPDVIQLFQRLDVLLVPVTMLIAVALVLIVWEVALLLGILGEA